MPVEFPNLVHISVTINFGMKTIFICNKCGTISISGNRKCPNCGADEKTGWSRIDIQGNGPVNIQKRFHTIATVLQQKWKAYWKSAVAVITIFTLLLLFLPVKSGILIAAGIAAAAFAFLFFTHRRTHKNKRLYKKLLRKAGGDKTLASRMIENEHRRNPEADINEWLKDANIRWERDLK